MDHPIPEKSAGKFSLPALGLGTYMMGGRFMRNPFNDDERDKKAMRAAIEMGFTHIDTAEVYARGHAERLVARVIKNVFRENLFITSKVCWNHLKYDEVIKACKGSLERLNIPMLDLYLIHAPDPAVSLKETMKAMDFLVENKMTRYIGVSNFDAELIAEAQSYTRHKISNNQIHYSILVRDYEKNGTLEYCQKNKILVTAYRPLEKGALPSKSYPLLEMMAEKYHVTPSQIAIKWLCEEPNVVVLVKSSNIDHLKQDRESLSIPISAEDLKKLKAEMPNIPAINVP